MKVLGGIILGVTITVVLGWACYAGMLEIRAFEQNTAPFPSWTWLGQLLAIPVYILLAIPGLIYSWLPLPKALSRITIFAAFGGGTFLMTRLLDAIIEIVKQRRATEAARQNEKLAHLQLQRDEQHRSREQLLVLGEQAIALFESLPKHAISANNYLDKAEFNFADGAFAPYWDSIEMAATALGELSAAVQQIGRSASRYADIVLKYEGTPPGFPVSRRAVERLAVAAMIATRMKGIVRTSQRNYQFATIYEQRRTNQILVAGFANLAQALDRMAAHISDSIDSLARSIDQVVITVTESTSTIGSRIGDVAVSADRHQEEWRTQASAAAAREARALEMLDNVQRGRRPFP